MTKRKKLESLLKQCKPHQQELFNKMYKSIEDIPKDKIDWAIQQCERTLWKNNGAELSKVIAQMKDEIKDNE